MDDAARARIHTSFAAQSMMATFGATLVTVEAEHVVITAPILPGSLQQQGFGHAGLTFSIGDSAAGYAALTTLPLDSEVVTAELKINLLAPAKGETFRMVGNVIKPGRTVTVCEGQAYAIEDGHEKLIATMGCTLMAVIGRDNMQG